MKKEMKQTKAYALLQRRESPFLAQVDCAVKYAEDFLPMIVKVFQSYTQHGMGHSIRVAEYMYELIDDAEKMSDLEIVMLIFSALFHDIGMAASDDEIARIKKDEVVLGYRKYSKVFEKYHHEGIALQECIRPVHGKRSGEFLEKMTDGDKQMFLIPGSVNTFFRKELAQICRAHNEEFEWMLKELRPDIKMGTYDLNGQYIAVLLRIADYLDIDSQRAPLYLYRYLKPGEHSDLEWRQHFDIQNFEKVCFNEKSGQKEIVFDGYSKDPEVHRKLLKYFDQINKELVKAAALCETFLSGKYLLNIKTHVVNRIQPEGFSFSDQRLELNYQAVTDLLMGENIYGDKKYGLRELIQNSIDACKTMQETAQTHEDFLFQEYKPVITIAVDEGKKKVTIHDNGSGMNIEILKKYFLNIGMSYYNSDEYKLQGRVYSPIGYYGIGFLSGFMLSDKVEVRTRHIEENKTIKIELERNSEYICLTYEEKPRAQGTEIILDYEPFMEVFHHDLAEVFKFIETNFLDCGIPINILDRSQGKTKECKLKKIQDILPEAICLNQYLNGVEAYVECNYRGINFAENIEDLNGCTSYVYDDAECKIVEERERNIPIKEFVHDHAIKLLTVPAITDEVNEFEILYEKLEDFDEALLRIDGYEQFNLIARDPEVPMRNNIMESGWDELIGDYTFDLFCNDLGHDDTIPTKTEIKLFHVVTNPDCEMVLPFTLNAGFRSYYRTRGEQVYLKHILLSNFRLRLSYLADGVELKNAVVNISHKSFYPNVSRDDVSRELGENLCNAVGRALHLWLLDHLELSPEARILLKDFIAAYYPADSGLVRKNAVSHIDKP